MFMVLIKNSLCFINSYLKGRKQIIKIISSCSLFAEIFGLPVRSILGPLLFNIYICDLFFFENSDTNLLIMLMIVHRMLVHQILTLSFLNFRKTTEIIFRWFHNNNLVSTAEKDHLIVNSKRKLEIEVSGCPRLERKKERQY